MKRILILLMLVSVTALAGAQLNGSGFYRVRNYGTDTYIWVCDNTGSINYATTSADMAAMQLWKGLDKAISEPASVLYFDAKGGNNWDITAQGTSVHKIIGRYVDVETSGSRNGVTFYQVSATEAGMTLYLSDVGSWGGNFNVLGTNGQGSTRRWIVEPIDASTDCYFGIEPTLTVGDKYYAPFYADFAFSFASTGMKAYYVSKVDGNIAVISEIKEDVIPASTPVIIECSSADKSDNRLNLYTGDYPAVSGNFLKGVFFCNEFRDKSKDAITAFDSSTMRVWSMNAEGKLSLGSDVSQLHVNWWGDDGKRYLNANESYLPVADGTATEMTVMTEEEYADYKPDVPADPVDINYDGSIDTQDVLDLYEVIRSSVSGEVDSKYDINRDGRVDTQDVLLIYEYIRQH